MKESCVCRFAKQIRYGLSVLFVLAMVGLWALPAVAASAEPVTVSVSEDTAQRIELSYAFGDFKTESVKINGKEYTQLRLEGESVLLKAGEPALPRVCRSVIIPDDQDMQVRVLSSDYYEVSLRVAPSKGNLLRNVDPSTVPYTFGPVYTKNKFYPGGLVQKGKPYILRDFRGLTVEVYPFQYNPVTGVLRVYTQMSVELTPSGLSKTNVLNRQNISHTPVSSFETIYEHQFVNYDSSLLLTAPPDEVGNLLIICYDAWLANVQPLVTHKTSVGIPTTAIGVSTIGNNATSIKNYIQNIYNQGNLAFVLLVGDSAQVATPTASGGSSDPTYSKLAGGDDYPDILVGRFSAETAAQVDTQVQRTIEYETMPATTQTWFHKGTGIGSEYGGGTQGDDGEADYVHIGNIRTQLLGCGYTLIDMLDGRYSPTAAQVSTALNAGRGIVNYCGHGSATSWGTTGFSNSNVTALTNDNMLPFIFSVACVNGQFAGSTCFAEAWLRATHNGEPTGAIAAYMSSINQSWNPPMEAQDAFNTLLCAGTYHSFGTLCYAGSCSMMDKYAADGVEMFDTWHVFGDPSLRVVGGQGMAVTPDTGLSAEGPAGGPFTPDSITYTIQNKGSTPLNYQVTNTENWLSIADASGTIPGNSIVTVTLSFNTYANSLGNGHYADTVQFINTTDHDGDTSRNVALKVGTPAKLFDWNLDTDPGWPVQGQWAFGHPTGQGGVLYPYPDPNNGHTGTNVYGVNLNGDYSTTAGGPWYVTLGPIDLHNVTETSLKFWRWLNTDYQPYVYATIEVSKDATNWTRIWQNGAAVVKDNAWSLQTYDISAVANNQAAVWIRWGYQVAGGAFAYSGWNIDDVEIWGLAASESHDYPGDTNCDGHVTFADIDPFVLALSGEQAYLAQYPDCPWLNADANGDGNVTFADVDPFVALIGT